MRTQTAGAAETCRYFEEYSRNQFVHQYAAMLRIILEFDYVEMAVIRFQQVGLGAAAHLADVPAGGERHGNAVP